MYLPRPHQCPLQFIQLWLDPPSPAPPPLLLPLCKGLGGYLLLVFWWGWMAFTSLFIVYPPIIGNEGPVHIHSIIPFYYRDCVGPHSLSTEMEFLNGIFGRGFRAWNRVFSDSSFCLVFYPHFSVLQNSIHEYTRVFLFHGFFCTDFKNQSRVCLSLKFASRRDCE